MNTGPIIMCCRTRSVVSQQMMVHALLSPCMDATKRTCTVQAAAAGVMEKERIGRMARHIVLVSFPPATISFLNFK